jgi:hypothetical protein
MSTVEQEILAALLELEDAVKRLKTAGYGPVLGDVLSRLDGLTASLPPDADGDLRHYLQRKSYEKARMWLEGRRTGIPSGACGR